MQSNDGVTVNGPYQHGRKWRVYFTEYRDGARSTTYESFASEAEAEECKAGAEVGRAEVQGVTVKMAVDAFIDAKRAKGRAPATIADQTNGLASILGPVMHRSIRYLSGRGSALYRDCTKGRAADTHQHALMLARSLGRYCVKHRWLKRDPFADVEPVGRKTFGADKPRLTVDESTKLYEYCLAHSDDVGCVLTLAYLLLGVRASELVQRSVRDLDAGGTLLWIGGTKTERSRRRAVLPEELQPMFAALAEGKKPHDPLFEGDPGKPWHRTTAWRAVRRVCKAAGVPVLCPQAMRRTQSTLATDAGETSVAVANHLGHTLAVSRRSYVDPSAVKQADVRKTLRVLAGGKR